VKGKLALWFLHRREKRIWQKRVAAAPAMIETREQHESSVSSSI
jgi:hypothetical protein